jgi:hypothetical protein
MIDVTPNSGPIVVACDNPQHPTRRFPTMALAESFLLGNAIFGDCLWQHSVTDLTDPDAAMRSLGELLASLIEPEAAFDAATMPACEADA